MLKRALRKFLAESGLTKVGKPDGRQYTIKNGKLLVEALKTGIEPLEVRRKEERSMRSDHIMRYTDAVFNINA